MSGFLISNTQDHEGGGLSMSCGCPKIACAVMQLTSVKRTLSFCGAIALLIIMTRIAGLFHGLFDTNSFGFRVL